MIIRPILFINYGREQHRDHRAKYVGSESKTFVRVLCEISQHLAVRVSRIVDLALVQSFDFLMIHLSGELGTVILVTHVLEYKILGIKRCSC